MKHSNKLKFEKSPYLLQHSENPVNWYGWHKEAFDKAKKENKPIFLSIGYSTCHWCHVMEKESFENEQVAELMNKAFISIKVDREERPDIDKIYMNVCQMLTGSGGWPLTIIMTPDKKPFYATTYIPRESMYGRAGMLELIPYIEKIWKEDHNKIDTISKEIMIALKKQNEKYSNNKIDNNVFNNAFEQYLNSFDKTYGGFGLKPKFPSAHNLIYLIKYWNISKNKDAIKMVEKTLTKMRKGGIYDQIGFGFHRYSTDRSWKLPHFEKMLYDQAMNALAYIELYNATKKEEYKKIVYEIFNYIIKTMNSENGGFYSAEDADSEGIEGKFYLWKYEELKKVLTNREFSIIKELYNIKENGNFKDEASRTETDENIIYIDGSITNITKKYSFSDNQIKEKLESIRKKLFKIRELRIHPFKDDKILTDWNSLMIVALSKASRIFNEPEFSKYAKNCTDFILKKMINNKNELLHRFRDNDASIKGNLNDYSFFVWALLELYQTTQNIDILEKAIELNNKTIELFWDHKNNGFFFNSNNSDIILANSKDAYDGAIPSGNSVELLNLVNLFEITGNIELKEKAEKLSKYFAKDLNRNPISFSFFLYAYSFLVDPPAKIIISGDINNKQTKEMLKNTYNTYSMGKIIILNNINNKKIIETLPYLKNNDLINNKTTAYICKKMKCYRPVTTIKEMIKLIKE